jgi:hypothetical protein
VGETTETRGSPDDEEAVVLTTLPVLRLSCDSRVDVLLPYGVAVAREKAKGTCFPLGPGDELRILVLYPRL